MSDTGSTVPRRQLGRYLRQAREEAGITVKAAADALEWSTPRLWRLEKGAVAMRSIDVRNMCEVYSVPADLTEAFMMLARETKSRGWWQPYGDAVPAWFELYVGLESAASNLRQYSAELVPGLLQTRTYTIEVIATDHPDMNEQDRGQRADIKHERQRLLSRKVPPAPGLNFVINEAVLRRPLPEKTATVQQLSRLVEATLLPNVSIRVVPLSSGIHCAATAGSFVILDFPTIRASEPEPTTVYSENVTGALYLDKKNEVLVYEDIWNRLLRKSLDEAHSRDLIAEIAKEYGS